MVYVDALRPCVPNRGWRWPVSCHLFTDPDTLDELHRFAQRIGMSRSWFQAKSFPHYDLTAGRRMLAIKAGAQELDRKGTVLRIRAWRALKHEMAAD